MYIFTGYRRCRRPLQHMRNRRIHVWPKLVAAGMAPRDFRPGWLGVAGQRVLTVITVIVYQLWPLLTSWLLQAWLAGRPGWLDAALTALRRRGRLASSGKAFSWISLPKPWPGQAQTRKSLKTCMFFHFIHFFHFFNFHFIYSFFFIHSLLHFFFHFFL